MAHNIEELVRAAAGMRATGMGWAAVGAALNRKESTVKKWPRLFGHHWKKYYEYSTRVVREETGTEAIAVLRCNLRSKNEGTQVKAAGLVLKHLSHRPMLVQFREPQGDRDHEIWDADDAAEERNILKWVNEHIEDAQREKKIPEGMDIDNLRREWVKKIRYDGGAAAAIFLMVAAIFAAGQAFGRRGVEPERNPACQASPIAFQCRSGTFCAHDAPGAGGGRDSPTYGTDMASPMHFPQSTPGNPPVVRIEVRHGQAKPAIYDITGDEFLIGSVPGCHLRLPGTNLPPVVCLIARQDDGVRLRKLAPTLPVLVNGQPVSQSAATNLTHGDTISVGATDIQVAIEYSFGGTPATEPLVLFMPSKEEQRPAADHSHRERELSERERRLEEEARELEADRILWYRRRDEIDKEIKQVREAAGRSERADGDLAAREERILRREEELNRRQAELQGQHDDLVTLREQTLGTRRELNERFAEQREQLARAQEAVRESLDAVKQRELGLEAELNARREAFDEELRQRREKAEEELRQWHNRGASGLVHLREQVEAEIKQKHRQRGEELDRFQISLREAAVQLRERKQELEEQLRDYEPRRRELEELTDALRRQREELDFKAAELQREREAFDLDRRAGVEPLVQKERDLELSRGEFTRLREQIEADRQVIEEGRTQYEADLIRLDRWQVTLDQRQQDLEARAKLVDERFEQFQKDARDLEEQVHQIDAREEAARAEEHRLAQMRDDLEKREATIAERQAHIEGQQAMVATLRTRLEHLREEQRQEAARIADERARIEEHERESKERLLDAERIREQIAGEQQGYQESEKVFRERSEILQAAVQKLRELQQNVAAEDERLAKVGADLDEKTAALAEREAVLQSRTEQLVEAQRRLEADRLALKQREESFFLQEGTRESLQEQLRRRAEELMTRGQELESRMAGLAEKEQALEALRQDASGHLQQVEGQAAELAKRDDELRQQREKLLQAEQALAEQKQRFDEAQAEWDRQKQEADAKAANARQEIEDLKTALAKQAEDLFGQVPELEARAQTALERTAQAREALRGQLAELHGYTRQSQEELEAVRGQVQAEIDRLRQQETALAKSRTEHRHAVASFRQQLVEWQSRFAEMKQALSQGESRVERREKLVDATSQQLAKQAEELEAKERIVAERRGEMERHLHDMREWYRKKLRDLVESRTVPQAEAVDGDADILTIPEGRAVHDAQADVPSPPSAQILSMQDDLDPADRKLGDLLRGLELVDEETLYALWGEARRQHRPLRQVLLAGSYLTLYQLALIETGNVNGLVLGRFRVIDRLQSTPREAIYRVFDSQRAEAAGSEAGVCVLRHLGEAEMHDAVRPDEYRQRFSAVRDVAHPNVAATWEVLDINGRPAVAQEWLRGLPGGEFPAVAALPGVWYRLLSQAALGLHTAHQAGVVHGRLTADSLVLTRDGMLKVTGLGEPPWLHPVSANAEPTAEDDLRCLGQVVAGWLQNGPKRRSKKAMPDSLLAILRGLGAEQEEGVPTALYASTAALLEELDRASRDVPADVASWEKLLEHVTENATEGPLLRQSA